MNNNTLDPRPDVDVYEVRRAGPDRVLWIVLGLVAVVAIMALAFAYTKNSDESRQAALDQAAAEQQTIDARNQALSSATSAAQTAGQSALSASEAAGNAARSAGRPGADAAADVAPQASQPAQGDISSDTSANPPPQR
jgi:hypothetical protein